MAQKKQLGQILLEAGAIDEFQLKSALGYQKQWGGRLGKVLLENRFITEEALVQAIHSQTGTPLVDLSREDIPEQVVKTVPVELAENLSLIPLRIEGEPGKPGDTLVLAMSDPTNLNAQDEVQFRVGKKIKALLAGEGAISRAIREYYYGEKASDSRHNVFQMAPDEIQFGGTELSPNEMVVVKGKLENAPDQDQSPAEFEDPFAELESLAKGPEPAKPANLFDSPPPGGPDPVSSPPETIEVSEEDELQEVEIVEELPGWDDEPTGEGNVAQPSPPPMAVTPLEDLEAKAPGPPPATPKAAEPPVPPSKTAEPPAPPPKADDPPVPTAPAEPKPASAQAPAPPAGATDSRDLSAFGAAGDLLGSVDEEGPAQAGSSAKDSPGTTVPPGTEEPGAGKDSGIADREETIRLRTVPRPQPVKKETPKPPLQAPEPEETPPLSGGEPERGEPGPDPDQEDTITLKKVPRPETGVPPKTAQAAEKPESGRSMSEKQAKPGSMEDLLSRVGIGNKTDKPESKPGSQATDGGEAARPRNREAKSKQFEDLLGEELVEEVQQLLESIESGEIDEEPPQIAKASHLIATVIRLLLRKEVFSEVELLEELKRR